jgi:hypothetical protein
LLIAVVAMVEKRIDFIKLDFGVLWSPFSFASLDSFVEKFEIRIAIMELDSFVEKFEIRNAIMELDPCV